jgi:hypothetical protein
MAKEGTAEAELHCVVGNERARCFYERMGWLHRGQIMESWNPVALTVLPSGAEASVGIGYDAPPLRPDQPGFAVDEPVAALGRELKLPPFLESRRREIEAVLPPLAPVERAA